MLRRWPSSLSPSPSPSSLSPTRPQHPLPCGRQRRLAQPGASLAPPPPGPLPRHPAGMQACGCARALCSSLSAEQSLNPLFWRTARVLDAARILSAGGAVAHAGHCCLPRESLCARRAGRLSHCRRCGPWVRTLTVAAWPAARQTRRGARAAARQGGWSSCTEGETA